MSKRKTGAYDEGYTAGQNKLAEKTGISSNPYNESEQNDQWSDWKNGYIDGLADVEDDPIDTDAEDDFVLDEDEYEDHEDDVDDDKY